MESVARALVPANYVKHDGLGVAHRREPMAELLPVSPSLDSVSSNSASTPIRF
jgi:hypothetical protein